MITLQEYFKEHQQSFWLWRDQTEVIALSDSSTLVYKGYLIEVLEALALADTPPLEAVLLALVATKPKSNGLLDQVQEDLMQLLYGGIEKSLEIPQGFDFLRLLQALPEKYHQQKDRLFLLQTIFLNSEQAFDQDTMHAILTQYKELSPSTFEGLVTDDGSRLNPKMLFRSLHLFKQLAQRFPTLESLVDALEERQRAEAPLLEEPLEDVDSTWRDKLVEDPQTFYMAALLPALQAGLALPARQRLQQQEAFGGTADLSNKGEFDRLLISEFAYDKTLFLSRLVNKEALYRQREASPERPALTRHLLLDTSIYNWGSIKQIAFGLALALEQTNKENISSRIYALGQEATLLQWNSVEQVGKELGQLSPLLHAAEGLEDFFKKNRPKPNQEVILISSSDAVQPAPMQQVMRHYQPQLHYWIAPTAKGKITTYHYYTGKKVLHEFQLTLNDTWAADKLPTTKTTETSKDFLPEEVPLLVPEPKHYEQLLWLYYYNDYNEHNHLFMLTNHGHVLRWARELSTPDQLEVKGWEWLYSNSFDYTSVEIGFFGGEFMLLAGMRSPARLDLINLTTKTQVAIALPEEENWYLQRFAFDQEAYCFYAMDNKERAWKVDLQQKPTLEPYPHPTLVTKLIKTHTDFILEQTSQSRLVRHYQILKNINSVSVTESGHLLINGRHQLSISPQGDLKISARNSPTIVAARQDYKKRHLRQFTFPDGSTVSTNSLGMMVLTSSDVQLPKIYLPMILNKPLGLAADAHFCGNTYYSKNSFDDNANEVTPKFFFTKYLKPFVEAIVDRVVV